MSSLQILAFAVLPCATVAAQQQISPSQIHPVTAQPKSITIDAATGKHLAPGNGQAAATMTIYNNTCTWATQAYYFGLESCEDIYDEGRIPSGAPGTGSDQTFDGFSFAYCTYNVAPFDCEIGYYNNLGGECVGTVPPTPPPISTTATQFFDFTFTGVWLPGSTTTGFQSCWLVTVTNVNACVLADGDGVFDGSQASDLFTWSFTHNMPTAGFGLQDGILMSGEPSAGAFGSCTYSVPCGTDPFTGGPCGTGLDTADLFWINVDGELVGGPPPAPMCPGSFVGGVAGTNCYWFGGYPGNPYASFYFTMTGGRVCGGCTGNLMTYCTPKVSTSGCLPLMSAVGSPSLSNPISFVATANYLEVNKFGIQFFGTTGPNSAPFQGGFLCVKPPIFRLPPRVTGGSGVCTGSLSYTLHDNLNSAGGPLITVGVQINQQAWFRDSPTTPCGTATTGLSDALQFVVCP